MPDLQEQKGDDGVAIEAKRSSKLGLVSGVYIPVFLNILSILMFLRFGLILGQVGFIGILGLLVTAYSIDLLTTLSLSAIASNGEVKGGGAYYLISRSLGPEFGGSIGVLFFLAQAVNTAMNIVGLVDCIRLTVGPSFPQGYWTGYGLQTAALAICTSLCLLGSAIFSKASNALLVILSVAILSIPISAIFKAPFHDEIEGVTFTGLSFDTLRDNFLPYTQSSEYRGLETFRDLFGILFPATSGIFAGASMSGDLKNPSKAIPSGTLWAMLTTFCIYLTVIISMAASTTHESLLGNANVISITSLSAPVIFAGECAVTVFSALMGIIGSAKLFQALAKDKLLPGLSIFGRGTAKGDEPIYAILLTHAIAQVALLADLNQIATLISMGYQMTFFVMNLACFLLKIGSAPNFRPSFQFFSWQTALIGALLSAAAMFFIEETYAAMAICVLIAIFLLIHYLCPPKRWGDVSQNLIYHQVRKYLLRLKPEHIKFWRPQIILLVNNPRKQARLIQFCNSLKKGSLYILGHVIVTDDFSAGVHEARLQQQAWTNYISEFSRIKAFVQLTMSPSITWGIRNLILSAGLGGMRPNIAVMGFYNMEELRRSNPKLRVPDIPTSPAKMAKHQPVATKPSKKRRRGDTSARLLDGILPTDAIRTEGMMSPTDYMTMLEDLTLQYRLNVGVAYGFEHLETPRRDGTNTKKYVDLWPIQMSAEVTSEGKNLVTTNFDTYTLILQLGHILRSLTAWRNVYLLRVMVFVEYESEVEEERARVRALLEKLRIEAEVLVFWLASGDLNTYELIINGVSNSMDYEIVVNEGLKDEEWWDELQTFRGQSGPMSTSQELTQIATILDSTSGRPGVFNPHEDTGNDRRRTSIAEFADMRKRPDIAMLSKLGVSMGIHTHHLNDEVLEESAEEVTDSEAETSDEEEDFSWEVAEPFTEPDREPLLQEEIRKKGRRRKKNDPEAASGSSTVRSDMSAALTRPTYGTISATQNLPAERGAVPSPAPRIPQIAELGASPSPKHTNIGPYAPPPAPKEAFPSFDPPPLADIDTKPPRSGAVTPSRPGMSRQSSAVKFSSRPVPETTITGEDSRISFAPHTSTPTTPAVERPSHSRQSSWGKFSSRPSAEPRFNNGEGSSSKPTPLTERTVPAPRSAAHSRQHSRQNSQYSTLRLTTGDLSDSIPELNDAQKDQNDAESKTSETDNVDSTFSTQSVALSFNDLPSRAQHLILNELMKQNSNDTAVLLSTLPIPSEGTCSDENSTIQYLSDVEVLCNELPPTLMVLSNNMTVTVSL